MTRTERRLRELEWFYPAEQYPRGSALLMLAIDTGSLWSVGGALIPTLAWMAEEEGSLFDSHWTDYDNPLWLKQVFDTRSIEHCSRVNAYFKTRWIFLGRRARNYMHPLATEAPSVVYDSYLALYRECRRRHSSDYAVLVPARHRLDQPNFRQGDPLHIGCWNDVPEFQVPNIGAVRDAVYPLPKGADILGYPYRRGFGKLQFYLWPEIYFRKAWGFTDDVAPAALKRLGIRRIGALYCDAERWTKAGFAATVIDADRPDDDEWTITQRVFNRWRGRAKGVAHGIWQHDKLHPGWLGFLIRNRYLPIYCQDWQKSMPVVARWAGRIKNRHIIGGGDTDRHGWDHAWMRAIAQYNLGRWKLPTEPEMPSIKRGIRQRYPLPEVTPWTVEYSDEALRQFAAARRIGVCQIWTITDIGYASMLPHILDIYQAFQAKCGFALDLPWVEYYGEMIQKMFTPAYAPYVEPLVYHTGLSWILTMRTNPVKCRIAPAAFQAQLAYTLERLRQIMGPACVPHGYVAAHYGVTAAEKRIVKKLGFRYLVGGNTATYLGDKRIYAPLYNHPYLNPQGVAYDRQKGNVLCEAKPGFAQIDFTWLKIGPEEDQIKVLCAIERNCKGPGTVLFTQDTGLGFTTRAFKWPPQSGGGSYSAKWKPAEFLPRQGYGYNIAYRAGVVHYLAAGGETGRYFTCKPNELQRYARIINNA